MWQWSIKGVLLLLKDRKIWVSNFTLEEGEQRRKSKADSSASILPKSEVKTSLIQTSTNTDSQVLLHTLQRERESDLQSFQYHSEWSFKLNFCYMFKNRRKAGLKTLSTPFAPSKIKLYRKLLYTSKFMFQLMDQCPKSKFNFSQLHTSGLRRWKTPCLVELHRAWMETTAQPYAGTHFL